MSTCPECGERMTGTYDGGEANNYELVVPCCNVCGYIAWDLGGRIVDFDELEEEPEED